MFTVTSGSSQGLTATIRGIFRTAVFVLAGGLLLAPGTEFPHVNAVVGTSREYGDQPYVLRFEKGEGRVIVIPGQSVMQFVVEIHGLEDDRQYDVSLERGDNGSVVFGQGNLHVQYGEKVTDTAVVPTQGQILLWSVQPVRVVCGAQARVIVRRTFGQEEAASEPFACPSSTDR